MGAITGTLAGNTEFAGDYKLLVVAATVASASDTITLTPAAHGGVVSIAAIIACQITGGLDAAFTICKPTFSGLVITLTSVKADGATAADDFTGTTVNVTLLARTQSA